MSIIFINIHIINNVDKSDYGIINIKPYEYNTSASKQFIEFIENGKMESIMFDDINQSNSMIPKTRATINTNDICFWDLPPKFIVSKTNDMVFIIDSKTKNVTNSFIDFWISPPPMSSTCRIGQILNPSLIQNMQRNNMNNFSIKKCELIY